MSRIETRSNYPGQESGSAVHRLLKLAKTGGVVGTMQFVGRWLVYKAHYHLYDRLFEAFEAVPTCNGVAAANLDYDDELRRHSVEYLAAPRLLVHKAVKLISEPLDGFTFVDIGSGLGRPLLVAAEYPFKGAIGYELSPSLHAGAIANIERSKKALDLQTDATSVNANALEADWPEGSRVFFLFNPFDREFMERFFRRVESTATPGTLHYLLLLNLKNPELLAHFPFERRHSSLIGRALWWLVSPYPLLIYRYAPQSQSPGSTRE